MALLSPTDEASSNIEATETNTEAISKNIASLIGGDKNIMTEDQNTLLRSSLGSYFLEEQMRNIYTDKI